MAKPTKKEPIPEVFLDPVLGPKIKEIISKELDKISGDSLIKIARQLDFWYSQKSLSQDEMLDVTKRLVETATIIAKGKFECPKTRFGRTEIQMPLLTCGGMRLQQTWMPDTYTMVIPPRSRVLKSPCQENVVQLIRDCLKMGMNHFETARFYGTSEYQIVEALYSMIQSGEIKREDFIFQTKLARVKSREDFEKGFAESWANIGDKLGYIDLYAFHCMSKNEQVDWCLSDADDMPMAAVTQLKKEGKIKHIGFSTHGGGAQIMKLVESNKFDFVNLHCHYFGSYHAEGTPDSKGSHGNKAVVKRALELDMGVFLISGVDKGGALYNPSATLANVIGPTMTPIEFGCLEAWKKTGIHTISIGLARPTDIVETLEAARLFTQKDIDAKLGVVEKRVEKHMDDKLGKDWESDMVNLPWCEDPSTDGVLIGHHLWLHNLMKAFGMYDFCEARYSNLEQAPWNPKKTFKENIEAMNPGNPGRGYDPKLDYTKALEKHANSERAKAKMIEAHEWLCAANKPEDRKAKGWEAAYDLRVWEAYPGEHGISAGSVFLQCMSFGTMGCGGGPTKSSAVFAEDLRTFFSA